MTNFVILLAVTYAASIAAFAFNPYDIGLQGLYPRRRFHTVDFEAPAPKITRWDSRCDYGSLFITPRGPWVSGAARGPAILDPKGDLVWMDNTEFTQSMNLNVQRYKGQDYLTFWSKRVKTKSVVKKAKQGGGFAKVKEPRISYVMVTFQLIPSCALPHILTLRFQLDSSYNVAYRIYPHGKGLKGDSHELRITPQGTAIIPIYHKRQIDCTELGLGKSCWIQDGLFQEIDIETGKLIFEWRATDHINMKDVFSSPNAKDGYGTSKKDAFDFFHINAVDKIDSGDYIISARYMHAIVCVSGETGEILWQLGGKKNSFTDLDKALDFSWQHHVTWQGNNTISLYDNHANSVLHSPSKYSKGMIVHLNLQNMSASLEQKYVHPDKILSVSQGSVQVIPASGNVLVGFGNSPAFVEYTRAGQVLCTAQFAPHVAFELVDFGLVKSYRVFKHAWVGRPDTIPSIKVKNDKAYVSWNGATEVRGWRLETAKTHEGRADEFVTVQELQRDGFETTFSMNEALGYVRIAALDSAHTVMAHSDIVRVRRRSKTLLRSLLIAALVVLCLWAIRRQNWRLPRAIKKHSRPTLKRLSAYSASKLRSGRGKEPWVDDEDQNFEVEPLLYRD
ncbi:hypothetical protein E4T39_08240 [Aureobasidium subglaciale]|nr:hypothetical protein E4T39_08240 [Aureobasidium subglaciale]